MKYEDFSAVEAAVARIKKFQDFERRLAKEPNGTIDLIPPVGSAHNGLHIYGAEQIESTGKTLFEKALAGRQNFGNAAIRRGIRDGIKAAKKELCTFLHDAGVDITQLKKELGLDK